MEMTRQRRRASQWEVIRAARAFYGRPLGVEDLQKIHAAQVFRAAEAASERSAAEVWREHAAERDIERMHRARQRHVEQAPVEGAA